MKEIDQIKVSYVTLQGFRSTAYLNRDDGDVYGQGVNIAVRLEQVARSGSVYVSRAAVEQARG